MFCRVIELYRAVRRAAKSDFETPFNSGGGRAGSGALTASVGAGTEPGLGKAITPDFVVTFGHGIASGL
jgi:hypothetical protein